MYDYLMSPAVLTEFHLAFEFPGWKRDQIFFFSMVSKNFVLEVVAPVSTEYVRIGLTTDL
jgi:hypothetical protein